MIGTPFSLYPAVSVQPDVTLDGTPVVIAATQIDFQNAVLVTTPSAGRADIRVGYALNVTVTLGTETTVAGAGNSTTLRAGDAVGAGPSNGGNVTLTPGGGIGGGTNGEVLITAPPVAGGTSVRPTTTNVVSLGSATLAYATTFTRAVRPDNNQALALSTVRVAAGAGPTLSLAAGAAFDPAANGVGGTVTITAGAGAGAGAGGAITCTAGAGGATAAGGGITLTTGAAGAGSGLAGGDLILVPGAGDGAGTLGLIRITATTATNLQPDTTNVVTLGAATLAFAAVRSRSLQADSGQSLTIVRGGGTIWATVTTAGNTTIGTDTGFNDNVLLFFGTGGDCSLSWRTASANNALYMVTGVNSAAQSGNILLTTTANISQEHGLAAVATPRLAIFSAADMSVAGNRTQYVQMYHSGTIAAIETGDQGAIGIVMRPRGVEVARYNADVAGGTAVTYTQRVNTSGTPTGLLWTAGAHTGLTLSTESIDWNVNLARTVQFSTGALTTQRAVVFQAPTYAFVGPSAITNAATVAITGPPIAGANCTFTGSHTFSLWVQTGMTQLGTNTTTTGAGGTTMLRVANGDVYLRSDSNSNHYKVVVDQVNGTGVACHYGTNVMSVAAGAGVGTSSNSSFSVFAANGVNSASRMTITNTGSFQFIQNVHTAGSPIAFSFTAAAHTTLAIAETVDQDFNNARTVNFAAGGGTIALQRVHLVRAPTYTATTDVVTITDAVTHAVTGAPVASTNITITRRWIATYGTLEAPTLSIAGVAVGYFNAGAIASIWRDTTGDAEVGLHVLAADGARFGTTTGHALEIRTNNTVRVTVNNAATMTLADPFDLVLGTTTGTKIGTATNQKIGFYNTTPVVQGAAIADPAGGAPDVEARAAIVLILSRLETVGLIAT